MYHEDETYLTVHPGVSERPHKLIPFDVVNQQSPVNTHLHMFILMAHLPPFLSSKISS